MLWPIVWHTACVCRVVLWRPRPCVWRAGLWQVTLLSNVDIFHTQQRPARTAAACSGHAALCVPPAAVVQSNHHRNPLHSSRKRTNVFTLSNAFVWVNTAGDDDRLSGIRRAGHGSLRGRHPRPTFISRRRPFKPPLYWKHHRKQHSPHFDLKRQTTRPASA